MPMPEEMPAKMMTSMVAFMQIGWLLPLVAVVEILGGALFMIPKTRALGAIVIFPVMVGILMVHVITDTTGLPIALVLMAINLWVIVENRQKYLPMIQ